MPGTKRSHVICRNDTGVLASVTLGLEEFITQQGGKSADILERVGLEQRLYEEPNRIISLRRYCNVLLDASHSLDDEYFGLHFGAQASPQGLGVFGYHAMSSANLRCALHSMQKYFSVFQQRSVLKISATENTCLLEYRLQDNNLSNNRHDSELTMSMLVNLLRCGMGMNWSPLAVKFRHSPLRQMSPHRDIFRCDVHFQENYDGILLRNSELDHTMADAAPMLHWITKTALEELACKTPPFLNFVQEVRQKIAEILPEGEACLEALAAAYDMSPRSFQRQLAHEGHAFKSLMDDVRHEQSLQCLKFQNVSVSEIAYRLGYSEVSAFTRAFMRWEKTSPTAWKKHYNLHSGA